MDTDETLDARILKKYRIHSLLGKGAYGIVWKAQEIASGQVVALKKVIGAFNNDVDAQRTYREVFLLQSMSHPNVVRLVNVHRADNDYDLYLVFEYVHTDLCQVIYDNILSDEQKVFIAYQMFLALFYLESLGVVHRDLKPANILINTECQIKVADLGLARTRSDSSRGLKPVMTEYVATKLYRSPEVMLGSSDYSHPTDVWSAGCIIGEMFTATPAVLLQSNSIVEQLEKYFSIFGRPSEEDLGAIKTSSSLLLLKSITPKSSKPLSKVLERSEKDLLDLVHRCMEFNPAKRITPLQALDHPFFKNSKITKQLAVIQLKSSKFKLEPILHEEIKLNSNQYRRELYGLILKKREDRKAHKLAKQKTTDAAGAQ